MLVDKATVDCRIDLQLTGPPAIRLFHLLQALSGAAKVRLLYELLKKLDAELKHEVCHWAAYYEHRMRLGQKAIFHLEELAKYYRKVSQVHGH
ncbi:hypothetical protein Prudu_018749 [Prunus dulcis]|uniref:Uncharacterized protein n=1 Tax=Prunus dulcis TaxID=3755 RepID=A0A4Y1RT55_PRUDU|nr:hypothetical protein Prudu_018749 [Prunus dulcis]